MLQGLDVLRIVPLDTLQHRLDLRLHSIHDKYLQDRKDVIFIKCRYKR